MSIFKLFHTRPHQDRDKTWFCDVHPDTALTKVWNANGGRLRAYCESCIAAMFKIGRGQHGDKTKYNPLRRKPRS